MFTDTRASTAMRAAELLREPVLHITPAQLRLIVFETSRAYLHAKERRESEQAAEMKRTRALELALLEIAEGRVDHR